MITLFENGRVFSPDDGYTNRFAVKDGRFIPVSEASAPDRVVDLQGRFVCPGFVDTHLHLVGYGRALCCCDLSEHTGSMEEALGWMSEYLKNTPLSPGQWLFARGWNDDSFTDVHRPIDRHDLDKVSRDVPIYAGRTCGHCVCVNTKALRSWAGRWIPPRRKGAVSA